MRYLKIVSECEKKFLHQIVLRYLKHCSLRNVLQRRKTYQLCIETAVLLKYDT